MAKTDLTIILVFSRATYFVTTECCVKSRAGEQKENSLADETSVNSLLIYDRHIDQHEVRRPNLQSRVTPGLVRQEIYSLLRISANIL